MNNPSINEPPLVFCDSCLMIDIINPNSAFAHLVLPIMELRAQKKITIGLSEITMAECCKLVSIKGESIDTYSLLEAYFSGDCYRRFPVTAPVSAYAAVLIRRYDLDCCDAVILATALVHRAKQFYTRDEKSLCKKLRKRTHPAKVKDKARADTRPHTFKDEQEVYERLGTIDIVELSTGESVEVDVPPTDPVVAA